MAHDNGLIVSEDGRTRCFWPGTLPDYLAYHDAEWGRPVTDDVRLFEKICLEGFQSGLSWADDPAQAPRIFAPASRASISTKVARFDDSDVERLLADKAHRAPSRQDRIDLNQQCGSRHRDGRGIRLARPLFLEPRAGPRGTPLQKVDYATLTANPTTAVSTRISKDLKKRGWRLRRPDHGLCLHAGNGAGQ